MQKYPSLKSIVSTVRVDFIYINNRSILKKISFIKKLNYKLYPQTKYHDEKTEVKSWLFCMRGGEEGWELDRNGVGLFWKTVCWFSNHGPDCLWHAAKTAAFITTLFYLHPKNEAKKKVSIEFTWMNDIKDRDPDVTVLSCDWLTCLILHQLLPEHHMVYLMAAEIHVKYVHFTISYLILALRVTGRNTYDIKGILPWMKCSVWFMSNGPTSV